MNHIDLFSGIGGFALAASWVWGEEHNVLAFCEQDKFCQRVIKKHWSDALIFNDIRSMKGIDYGTNVTLLTGGFPCQPFSLAGKRKGQKDNRYLWPKMFRVIQEAEPEWIIAENVPGILSSDCGMVFEHICFDLENSGYEVTPFVIPAGGIGAKHIRERVWILANNNNKRLPEFKPQREKHQIWLRPDRMAMQKISSTLDPSKAFICRGDDGIPNRVDRIKSLGNAIVPHVVVPIMQTIKQIEESI